MIVVKTPLRLSFVGGASDLPAYSFGEVVNCAIDKYIYVTLHKRCDDKVLAVYSKREVRNNTFDLKHELMRAALLDYKITNGVEIHTYADIQSKGSGLGSSGSVCVGLLQAAATHANEGPSASYLAERAFRIEACRGGCGWQDQYAAACGGMNHWVYTNGKVSSINRLPLNVIREFKSFCMLFRLPQIREAKAILLAHKQDDKVARDLAQLCKPFMDSIIAGDFETAGELISTSGKLKNKITPANDDLINSLLKRCKKLGTWGRKVAGAGRGGHLFVVADTDNQDRIAAGLELEEIAFRYVNKGTHILVQEDETY